MAGISPACYLFVTSFVLPASHTEEGWALIPNVRTRSKERKKCNGRMKKKRVDFGFKEKERKLLSGIRKIQMHIQEVLLPKPETTQFHFLLFPGALCHQYTQ